jgi:hypothetical protein
LINRWRGALAAWQDVWSFGVVLWEIFTDGAEPFEELSPEVRSCIHFGPH